MLDTARGLVIQELSVARASNRESVEADLERPKARPRRRFSGEGQRDAVGLGRGTNLRQNGRRIAMTKPDEERSAMAASERVPRLARARRAARNSSSNTTGATTCSTSRPSAMPSTMRC
jgi:hypothetical protein